MALIKDQRLAATLKALKTQSFYNRLKLQHYLQYLLRQKSVEKEKQKGMIKGLREKQEMKIIMWKTDLIEEEGETKKWRLGHERERDQAKEQQLDGWSELRRRWQQH